MQSAGWHLSHSGSIAEPASVSRCIPWAFGFRMEPNAYSRDGLVPIIPSRISRWLTANREDLLTCFTSIYRTNPGTKATRARGFLIEGPVELTCPDTHATYEFTRHTSTSKTTPSLARMLSTSLQPVRDAFLTIERRELLSSINIGSKNIAAITKHLLRQIDQGKSPDPSASDLLPSTSREIYAQHSSPSPRF